MSYDQWSNCVDKKSILAHTTAVCTLSKNKYFTQLFAILYTLLTILFQTWIAHNYFKTPAWYEQES